MREVYTDTPEMTAGERQPVQQQQLHTVPLARAQGGAAADSLAVKMQLLRAEVKRYKEQEQVKKLEKEVEAFKTHHASGASPHRTSLGESKYLQEDEKAAAPPAPAPAPAPAAAHATSGAPVPKAAKGGRESQKQRRMRQEKADERFEAAREHLAVHEADSSQEDVARLRAEVDVMRARIKTLERKEGVKGSDKLLELPEDADVQGGEVLQSKARQQLLSQFRRGALHAGRSGDDFWKRKTAEEAAAKYKMEALSAGAKSFDQVEELKSALQRQEEETQKLRREISRSTAGVSGARAVSPSVAGAYGTVGQPAALEGAGGRGALSSWAQGLAEVRREMSGVRRDMDETAGREDDIVGRISELGSKIGGLVGRSPQQ